MSAECSLRGTLAKWFDDRCVLDTGFAESKGFNDSIDESWLAQVPVASWGRFNLNTQVGGDVPFSSEVKVVLFQLCDDGVDDCLVFAHNNCVVNIENNCTVRAKKQTRV
mmetsp:Transcript_95891/g.276268  ORF Transcript_95891/g.276268 Transcript_95891/m.276268 type:complete len:109 (+) Transcript_95891:808-1134(+)